MHLLIVEDNLDIQANLFAYLEPAGHTLDAVANGAAGVRLAASGYYDAIVLDLSLPGMDGLDACRQLRRQCRLPTPILMLTARDSERDKLAGFEAGADDYMVKPYSLPELEARLKALVRRARNEHVEFVLHCGELQLDAGTGQVWRGGRLLALPPTAYRILLALMRQAPRLVSREALEHELWGDDPPDSDALRTHIHALRQAIDKPFDQPLLLTIPGQGYRLKQADES